MTVGGVMRSSVNFRLPIRNAITLTAGHRRVGQARRSNFHVRSVLGLLLFLMKGKIQYGRVRMSLTLAVLLVYIAVLCSRHCVNEHEDLARPTRSRSLEDALQCGRARSSLVGARSMFRCSWLFISNERIADAALHRQMGVGQFAYP